MKQDKSTSKINFKIVLITMLLVLLFIYLFMFDFSRRVDYQTRSMTTEHLADINSQSVVTIEKKFSNVQREIRLMSKFISETPELSEEALQRLYQELKEKCGFTNVRLIAPDGGLYSTEHELLPKSSGGYVEAVCRGESGLTDVFSSSITGEEVFAFYAPILQESKPVGGIAGIMNIQQMVDIISSTGFNGNSYTYILKPDGTVIMQTSHPDSLYSGRDYLNFLENETTAVTFSVEELREKMERKESGTFVFRKGKEQRISYYSPAGINNWYVVTEVSYDISNVYQERINLTALYLALKIVALFLILAALIIIWFKKAQKIILDSKTDLELEKKKLELALRHASNSTFEYIPKNDSLTFITPPKIKDTVFPVTLPAISTYAASYGLVSADYLEQWKELLSEAAHGGAPEPLEFTGGISFKDDVWFRLSISPVKNSKGEIIELIGTLEDITEEKRIKSRFAQEEQYRAAFLSKSVIMWSVNLAKQQVIAFSVTGQNQMEEREPFPYDDKFIQKMCRPIHSEDHERIFSMVQVNNMLAAFYTQKRELKELFRATYPHQSEYRWMTCTISLLEEPTTGAPVAFAYVMDVDAETRQKMDLAYSSERDPLTGLYNRRVISDKVEQALADKDSLSCLMIMDLDNFKGINDTYGHQEGDRVLKKLAKILTGIFRASDLSARLGGDEFIVFMDHLPNRDCAHERAEEIRRQVFNLNAQAEENTLPISVSIGLAFGPEDGDTFQQLYAHVDEALYTAKRKGKNQIAAFENDRLN